MNKFDPNHDPETVGAYLSVALGRPVQLTKATQLVKSSRQPPWRLEVATEDGPQSFILYYDSRKGKREYMMLKALESLDLPTPRTYGWDPEGAAFGRPCYFTEYLDGESLLGPMLAGERWAAELYIETAFRLQGIAKEELPTVTEMLEETETATFVLDQAKAYFAENPHPLTDKAYHWLEQNVPPFPDLRFSNGDLYPDNILVKDQALVGVIDFEHAGFSDPLFEFLLPFFLHPELRGRGTLRRYLELMAFDPAWLDWYHGLEIYDSWHWVRKLEQPYEQHTDQSLEHDLRAWLASRP